MFEQLVVVHTKTLPILSLQTNQRETPTPAVKNTRFEPVCLLALTPQLYIL